MVLQYSIFIVHLIHFNIIISPLKFNAYQPFYCPQILHFKFSTQKTLDLIKYGFTAPITM